MMVGDGFAMHGGGQIRKRGRRLLSAALVVLALALVVPVTGSAAPGLPGCTIQGAAPRECSFESRAKKIVFVFKGTNGGGDFQILVQSTGGAVHSCGRIVLNDQTKFATCDSGPGSLVTVSLILGAGVVTATDNLPAAGGLGCMLIRSKPTDPEQLCLYPSATGVVQIVGAQVPPLTDFWAEVLVTRRQGAVVCHFSGAALAVIAKRCKTDVLGFTIVWLRGPHRAFIAARDVPA